MNSLTNGSEVTSDQVKEKKEEIEVKEEKEEKQGKENSSDDDDFNSKNKKKNFMDELNDSPSELNKKSLAKALLQAGLQHDFMGETEKAISCYEEAIEMDGSLGEAYERIIQNFSMQHNLPKAEFYQEQFNKNKNRPINIFST